MNEKAAEIFKGGRKMKDEQRINELQAELNALSRKIRRGEEILAGWRREFSALAKEKEALERAQTKVRRLPTRGKPRSRTSRQSQREAALTALMQQAQAGTLSQADLMIGLKRVMGL